MIPFCNLFMERPSYYVMLRTNKKLCCHATFTISVKTLTSVEWFRPFYHTPSPTVLGFWQDWIHSAELLYSQHQSTAIVCWLCPAGHALAVVIGSCSIAGSLPTDSDSVSDGDGSVESFVSAATGVGFSFSFCHCSKHVQGYVVDASDHNL